MVIHGDFNVCEDDKVGEERWWCWKRKKIIAGRALRGRKKVSADSAETWVRG